MEKESVILKIQKLLALQYGAESIDNEGEAAGAAPSVSFEAAEGEALNITGKENNPMVDALVQAIENQ